MKRFTALPTGSFTIWKDSNICSKLYSTVDSVAPLIQYRVRYCDCITVYVNFRYIYQQVGVILKFANIRREKQVYTVIQIMAPVLPFLVGVVTSTVGSFVIIEKLSDRR